MTVNVSLTPESIQNAIKELKAYKKRIETGTDKLLDKMADDGVEKAQRGYTTNLIYAGTTEVNCRREKNGKNKRTVIAEGKSVLFIGFGSGGVYPDDHPEAQELGMIRGEYGHKLGKSEKGWRYKGDPGTSGVPITEGPHAGEIFTVGNPAKKAMYNARKEIEEEFTRTAKEAFAK